MTSSYYRIVIIFLLSSLQDNCVFGTSITECKSNLVGQGNLFTHGELCLRIVTNHRSWHDARKGCTKRGGDLIQIRDATIQQAVRDELTRLNLKDSKFWIGATDIDKEGQWEWVSGDTTMTYSHWKPGQGPNQRGFLFSSGTFEDCALLDTHDSFQWHDYPCRGGPFFQYSSICQYKMTTSLTTAKTVTVGPVINKTVQTDKYSTRQNAVTLTASTKLHLLSSSPRKHVSSPIISSMPSFSKSTVTNNAGKGFHTSKSYTYSSPKKLSSLTKIKTTVSGQPVTLSQTIKKSKSSQKLSSQWQLSSIIIHKLKSTALPIVVPTVKQTNISHIFSWTSKGIFIQTTSIQGKANSSANIQDPGFLTKSQTNNIKSHKGIIALLSVLGCCVIIIAVVVTIFIVRRNSSNKGKVLKGVGLENPLYGLRNDTQTNCLSDGKGLSTCDVHINDIYS